MARAFPEEVVPFDAPTKYIYKSGCSTFSPTFGAVSLFNVSHSGGCEWYLTVGLVTVFPMAMDLGHFFMHVSAMGEANGEAHCEVACLHNLFIFFIGVFILIEW